MVLTKQHVHSILDAVENSQEKSLELCKRLTKLEDKQLFVVISLVLSVVATNFVDTFFEPGNVEAQDLIKEAIEERKGQTA
jgi:hypothetical protein